MTDHTSPPPTSPCTAQSETGSRFASVERDALAEHEIHLPPPSVWPIVLAFGLTITSFGFLANIIYGIFGAVVITISLWGWVGAMRHD